MGFLVYGIFLQKILFLHPMVIISFEVVGGEMGCCAGEEYEFMCVHAQFVWCGVSMCSTSFKKPVLLTLISHG